jgi:SAM-dependent methyltransferase
MPRQELLLDRNKVKDYYEELGKGMQKAIQISKTAKEEKLKINTILEFDKFFAKFGIKLTDYFDYEQTSTGGIKLKGRTDILSGSLIMEFKIYGNLDKKTEYAKAVKQVKEKYLEPLDKKIASRFNAVIFDGKTTVFMTFSEKRQEWRASKKPFNNFTLYDWVLLISKTLKIPISSQKLKDSFSIQNQLAINAISVFYSALTNNMPKNKRIKMLFDEWDKSFSYIYGGILSERKVKEDFYEIATIINKNYKDIEINKFLFCFYTYYAFIVKLYASEIASIFMQIKPESPINALIRSQNLKDDLQLIESGDFYKFYADIENYIEGGFFSWYIDAWDKSIEDVIKSILYELNKFDFENVVYDELNSRDILKTLYQEIIPQKIRHDLGEYYTPTWLIQSLLNDIGFEGKLDKKILDAGCGSGGFLVEAINKIKQRNKDLPPADILPKIIANVVGFDVNPVAVLTARTNYLLAISSYLKGKAPIQITIPIYLADSIITPTTEGNAKLFSNVYSISTVEGIFWLPKTLIDYGHLNEAMRVVEECFNSNYPKDDFKTLFNKKIGLEADDLDVVVSFYEQIKQLHKDGKNRIWVKLIQNSFAPLLHTEFDYVIGNPPWIKWDFLSREYKNKLGNLYLNIYKLFSHKGMKAGMGYSHDDISAVFMYVSADKYLKNGGKLGYVMKQTLYKSVAGKEFRKFKIEKGSNAIPLKVVKVNDMLKLKPFKSSAQAETSTIIFKKGEQTTYPVEYNVWTPKMRLPNENERIENVINEINIERCDAYPHNPKDNTDVWVIMKEGKEKTAFEGKENFYVPRHGIVNDLNGVFFLDILSKENDVLTIENRVEKAKKPIPKIETTIEKDLIYPFLKPKNIKRWKTQGYVYGLIPQKKHGENNESELRVKYPLTYKYLYRFKENLGHRASKWFKIEGFPFYSIFGVGEYSFAPYKVVWCCMTYSPNFAVVSDVNDKFIGKKKVMCDNTIGYFSVNTEVEAYFICGILNSKKVGDALESRSSKSKWGISINMVKQIPIPKFDKSNEKHVKIAELAKSASIKEDAEIQKEIDKLASQII